MKLLIDIGNTRAKYIIVNNVSDKIQNHQVISVNNADFRDSYFTNNWNNIDQIIIASVNDESMTEAVIQWANKQKVLITQVKTQKQRYGVQCAYQVPANLGVDRWLALLGANVLYPQKNCLIIDAGTAITFDLLLGDGNHQGGWIVPGIDLLYKTLMSNTANIKADKSINADLQFGNSSAACVNNGIWAMAVGTIEQAIKEAQSQVEIDHILLCGGSAKILNSLIENVKTSLVEELIFNGLQRYIGNNSN